MNFPPLERKAHFSKNKTVFRFREVSSRLHALSLHTVRTSKTKFVPTYDSSIPLNPWSKVSMSGYMVSGVKKTLPGVVDKVLLKLIHVVEKLEE